MSIKNKIFLVFALTFAVLGGAGVYFYNSFSGHSGDFYYYEVERERSGEIIPFVELKNIVGNRSVRNNPVTTNDLSDDISGNLSSELTRHKNPTANNFSESSRSRYTYSRINKDNNPLSSSGFVNPTLSLGSTGGKSTSSSSNSANDGYGGSITTGKIDIPFSAPKANGTNNTYLVDPGAMPLNESMRIPVGDGLWILFILGAIYFLRLFFRK